MAPRYVTSLFALLATSASLLMATPAKQAAQTPDARVAALKQSLADSKTRLKKYEWIETTAISLKGEEKSRKQLRCYYGADGKLQKLPVGDAPAAAPAPAGRSGGRGGRVKGAIVDNKKDEMKDYMEQAAALIHQYVPPDPAKVQSVKDAKKLAVTPMDQGHVRLELSDYLQAGDKLTLVLDAAKNSLVSVNVATYLDKKEDVVALDVKFGSLADGTGYNSETTFDAKAKNIRVVITNTGHRPLSQ